MRICHLTSVHSHNDIRIFVKECRSLTNCGYYVYLVAPNSPNNVKDGVHLCGVTSENPKRIMRMTTTVWKVYKRGISLNADIYHFHDPELLLCGVLLHLKGKKVIYDVHEDAPRQILSKHWIHPSLRKFISETFEKFENICVKYFDGIIGATPTITHRFQDCVANCINVNNYPILDELAPNEGDWVNKEHAACYVGGIAEIRGIVEMVKAIAQTEAKLFLAGNYISKGLQSKVTQLYGWEKVQELGFVNRQQIKEILEKSMVGLVLLHPTKNYIDSLPVKLFEYMSAGIPVIASNFSLWREIIEGNHCGICVDPLNVTEIANAIKWLVEHPQEAEKRGDNGRKAVLNKYNWEAEEKKLLNLYREIAQ